MKYLLKVKFPASSIEAYDELIALEDEIIGWLGPRHDLDGHDFGEGEFNIFILTDNPKGLAQEFLKAGQLKIAKRASEISFRKLTSEEFVSFWPDK